MSRFRGSIDVPLNRDGWVAAIKAGYRLKNQAFELIVHDWQQRTINTAKAIQLFHPNAILAKHDVHSQQLGWLEGEEVTEDSLAFMEHYIKNPYKIPGPGYRSEREPQSFGSWLNEWFRLYYHLKRYAEQNRCKTLIVTHNRNIQALLSREGDWINEEAFDVSGPKPCEIVHISHYLSTIRHGDTSWGT
jgi:broad specificity phosphatase PhoE